MQKRKKTAGGFWMTIIILAAFITAIIAFAVQTWELVDTIFPVENIFMKIATVVSLDIMSVVFAATEMFYPFQNRSAKHLAAGMWLVTFVLALLASVIYMYLSSLHVLSGIADARILAIAYAIVVLAMAADVIAITVGIRMEWNATHPEEVSPPLVDQQLSQTSVQQAPQFDMQALATALVQAIQAQQQVPPHDVVTGKITAVKIDPLAKSPLVDKGSQNGKP